MAPLQPWFKITFVRVRDEAGRLGVVYCVALVPVVPAGTPISIVERDPTAPLAPKLEPAVVVDQPPAQLGITVKVRTRAGVERLVGIRDLVDAKRNEISSLRDPYIRYH